MEAGDTNVAFKEISATDGFEDETMKNQQISKIDNKCKYLTTKMIITMTIKNDDNKDNNTII